MATIGLVNQLNTYAKRKKGMAASACLKETQYPWKY